MANTVLGKVSCVPRGDYSAAATYYALDIVGYQGGSYLAMQEVTGVTPSNDQTNWMQLSEPGSPGEQGQQGDPGAAAGFGTVSATVSDTTGTPDVSVQTSGPDTAKNISFSFSGLKGETGEKGDTGDTGPQGETGAAAGFGQPTATVDNNVGTPGVSVTSSGPDTAKVFAFQFTNLKGETGDQGIQGVKGDPGTSVSRIERTSGTGAAGTTDTYTMYDSDDEPIGTFTVYNGSNGTGSGDFMANGAVPMTGALNMGGNKVTGMAEPTADTDGATKGYVDEAVGSSVTSFNGRTGAVTPQEGDYTAAMVGARADTWTPSAEDVGAIAAPTGGTTGQVLTKTETGEEWRDAPSGLPEGGTEGQMLYKGAEGVEWGDKPVMYVNVTMTSGTEGTADKTSTEIVAAVEKGYAVYAILSNNNTHVIVPYMEHSVITDDGSIGDAIFGAVEAIISMPMAYSIFVSNNGQAELVSMALVATDTIGAPNGVASLDFTGKVPTSQLPNMDYIPTSQKGANSGVATLGTDGILTGSQRPTYTASDVGAIANPNGGTTGQILEKTETGTQWADKPASGMTQTQADERYLQLSGGTMTGALSLPGNPTSDNHAANKAYVDSKRPLLRTATLTTSGWSDNSQTVTVQGVVADTNAQKIDLAFGTKESAPIWAAAGCWCSAQGANSLTFTCDAVPTDSIVLNIAIQEAQS